MVAVLAHGLAVIRNRYFDGCVDEGSVAVAALYHDASEILTGDLPTPIKYYNHAIRDSYKAIESVAQDKLLSMLPEEMQSDFEPVLKEADEEVVELVKAADKLSAYIKCVEEQKAGNTEFDSAAEQTMQALHDMDRPELEWFLEQCLPAFFKNLDQL